MELERERLVGAGERRHAGEVTVDIVPVEDDHAAPLADQPLDRVGEHGERTAEAVGVFEALVAEQQGEPASPPDRARLERDGAQVD